jgi:hypothetical protein
MTPISHTVYSIENGSETPKKEFHNMAVKVARLKHTIYSDTLANEDNSFRNHIR